MIDKYRPVFVDAWEFMKKYDPPQKDEEYWKEVIAEASKTIDKYKGTPLEEYALSMIVSTVGQLERSYMEGG